MTASTVDRRVVALPVDVMVSVAEVPQVALIAAMLGFARWYRKRGGLGVRPYLESIGAGW